jgi:hypothetical protein
MAAISRTATAEIGEDAVAGAAAGVEITAIVEDSIGAEKEELSRAMQGP